MLAARGHEVVGVDVAAAAVERARRKARERGLTATFQVADALDLDPGALGRTFDTVIDCGLFHTFTDEGRERYAASVARVLAPGGVLHLMCFSEETPGDWGPRRVRQREIRALFGGGFRVVSIRAARFDTNLDEEIHAWLATVVRASADA
jgi:SAM-dependent methyltransferase